MIVDFRLQVEKYNNDKDKLKNGAKKHKMTFKIF